MRYTKKAFREIPYPGPKLATMGVTLQLSGWCSKCGVYLERATANAPITDPGSRELHTHSNPWRLGPKEKA